jgi:hypothetical protein
MKRNLSSFLKKPSSILISDPSPKVYILFFNIVILLKYFNFKKRLFDSKSSLSLVLKNDGENSKHIE